MQTTRHTNWFALSWPVAVGCALLLSVNLVGKGILESEPEIASLLDKLEPLPVESLPATGTFWLVKKNEPPWPVLPPVAAEFKLPVYPLDDKGAFIVDDRAVDYVALAEFETALRAVELELGLTRTTDSGPPMPGDDEPEGEVGGIEPSGWGYPSNVLWLRIVTVTNQTGCFVVHSPQPNSVFDLFGTTNLSPYADGFV